MTSQPHPNHRYTWLETRAIDDQQRWELIDGQLFAMGSPRIAHQLVSVRLTGALLPLLAGNPCQLLVAPTDVKLSEHDLVQPDLRTHVEGPPRLVIEILSESTQRHDRIRKLNLYARRGVGEYWLFTPHPALVEVLHNDGAGFRVALARLVTP